MVRPRHALLVLAAIGALSLLLVMQHVRPRDRSRTVVPKPGLAVDADPQHARPRDPGTVAIRALPAFVDTGADPEVLPGPAMAVAGRVTLNGRALPGARVLARAIGAPVSEVLETATTGLDGLFAMRIARRRSFLLIAQHSRVALRPVLVYGPYIGDPPSVHIEVHHPVDLRGRVVDEDGDPMTGVSVACHLPLQPGTSDVAWERTSGYTLTTRTDPSGEYSFTNMPIGLVEIEALGLRDDVSLPTELPVDIVVGGIATLAGSVLSADDTPVAHTQVVVYFHTLPDGRIGSATAVTDGNGTFSLDCAAPSVIDEASIDGRGSVKARSLSLAANARSN